jgi:hypothetical protein
VPTGTEARKWLKATVCSSRRYHEKTVLVLVAMFYRVLPAQASLLYRALLSMLPAEVPAAGGHCIYLGPGHSHRPLATVHKSMSLVYPEVSILPLQAELLGPWQAGIRTNHCVVANSLLPITRASQGLPL